MEIVDEILGTKGLMEHFHISRSTVQRLLARGVPRTKVGTRNCFTEEQMGPWFDANPALDPWRWSACTLIRNDTRTARGMFKEFNKTFWRNRLPHYDVKVVRDIPDDVTAGGICDTVKKQILIHWDMTAEGDGFRSTVLHEMCHVATPQGSEHGWQFRNQLKRLQRMGEEWAEEEVEFCKNDETYGVKWLKRVVRRMIDMATKNSYLTLEQVLNQVAGEFSVSTDELRQWIPDLERGWKLLSIFGEQIVSAKESIKRSKRLIRKIGPEDFGVTG